MHSRRDDQRQATADLIAPRPDQQLPEGKSEGRRREGQLDEGGRDIQILLNDREGRQVQVDRERPERGERPEHEHIDEPLARQKGITGMDDDRHVAFLSSGGETERPIAEPETVDGEEEG